MYLPPRVQIPGFLVLGSQSLLVMLRINLGFPSAVGKYSFLFTATVAKGLKFILPFTSS